MRKEKLEIVADANRLNRLLILLGSHAPFVDKRFHTHNLSSLPTLHGQPFLYIFGCIGEFFILLHLKLNPNADIARLNSLLFLLFLLSLWRHVPVQWQHLSRGGQYLQSERRIRDL